MSAYEPVFAAVHAACAELEAEPQEFRELAPGQWARPVGTAWSGPVRHALFLLDTRALALVAYVELALPRGDAGVTALAEAATRANYGLVPATFEVDMDDGEVRVRNVWPLGSSPIDTAEAGRLLADALQTAAAYAPAFAAVAAGTDPRLAIEDIEGA